MLLRLAEVAWPDVPSGALLVVPLGSTEQHGPHLPFTVDADIAERVAEAIGRALSAVVAPVLSYGASGEHAGFPGTLSIGTEVLRAVLIELVRSADWAARVVFVNGHGGNLEAVADAVSQLRREQHDVAWMTCGAPDMDLHAGHAETSMMLALRPDAVGIERPAGAIGSAPSMLHEVRARGVRGVSANGVLGDATGAASEWGAEAIAAMTRTGIRRIRSWQPDEQGRLEEDL